MQALRALRRSTIAALTFLAFSPLVHAEEPFVDLDVDEAFARAGKQKGLVILYFHDPDSTESKRMLRDTFRHEKVKAWIERHAVALLIDKSDKPTIARFGVTAFPRTSIFTADERLVHRIEGPQAYEDFLLAAETALMLLGKVNRPEGAAEENPIAWLVWANWLFTNDPGRVDEASESYFWCLDHGDEHMPGFRAQRLEFILERLSYLKQRSNVALDGLLSRRRDLEGRMRAGIASPRDAYDYTRFNYWLRDQYVTVNLFVEMASYETPEHLAIRRALLAAQLIWIVDHRHHALVLDLAPCPIDLVRPEVDAYMAQVEAGRVDTMKRAAVINDAAAYYECLLHAGRGQDAEELLELVTDAFPTGRCYVAFINRTNRLLLYDLSRSVADGGLEKLSGRAKKVLERARAKIPTEDSGDLPSEAPKKGGGGQ